MTESKAQQPVRADDYGKDNIRQPSRPESDKPQKSGKQTDGQKTLSLWSSSSA